MKLKGVDFWSGHKNILTMFDGEGDCGPVPIQIDEKVRQGTPFRIKIGNSTFNDKIITFINRQIKNKTNNCAVIVDVYSQDKKQQYYRIEMHSLLREFTFDSFNTDEYANLVLVFQAREIFETYDKRLQDVFGEGMHNPYFSR